ncbi:uncharacterized protein LOC144619846 [Crassostrea virginica]
MVCVLLFLSLVSVVYSATTTHHPHNGHIINEALSFHYDSATHIVAMKTHHHCYLYVLNAHEQQTVHTSTGLHAIEKKIIDLVDSHGTTVHFTAQDVNLLSHGLGKFCGHFTTLKIN